MTHSGLDTTRLTEPERRILRLLAEGHTVKSVAALLESTTGSVNERLREARRKTGTGSSRELARLLRDQENRDDKIGVVGGGAAAPGLATAATGLGRSRRSKGLAMAAIILTLAAAGSLFVTGQGDAPQDVSDPMPAASDRLPPSPRELHARLVAEARDAPWADETERSLAGHYRKSADVAPGLRVTCRQTLCEVAGSFRPGLSPVALQAAMDRVQIGSTEATQQMGLKVETSGFTFRKMPKPSQSFFTHLSRIR